MSLPSQSDMAVNVVCACVFLFTCVCVYEARLSTSHVIAVPRLQRQHQARCVDVPGYLESYPPARFLTGASITALTCQPYTNPFMVAFEKLHLYSHFRH